MRRVLDTNVALYLLAGRLAEPLKPAEYFISVITELELLSYPGITPAEEGRIRALIDGVILVGLNAEVREETVHLRRKHNIKLPDAIICATACVLGAELLTNDERLCAIAELKVLPVMLRPDPR